MKLHIWKHITQKNYIFSFPIGSGIGFTETDLTKEQAGIFQGQISSKAISRKPMKHITMDLKPEKKPGNNFMAVISRWGLLWTMPEIGKSGLKIMT